MSNASNVGVVSAAGSTDVIDQSADSGSADERPATGTTSRRALIGAGLGALIATVATAIGRPLGAKATDGDPVIAGQTVLATNPTGLTNSSNNANVLIVQSQSGTAVYGGSSSAYGVAGASGTSAGTHGFSSSGHGVEGRSTTGIGVYGYGDSGNGVYAYSGGDSGVLGYTDSPNGDAGVKGLAHSGKTFGVFGENLVVGTVGILGGPAAGVVGEAPNGAGFIGVSATAPSAATALNVSGKAAFSRSGRASVAPGKSFVDVTVPGGLGSNSLVIATPMLNRAGVYVQAAVPNSTTGVVRIYLNRIASSSASTPIAWFVIN